MADITTLSAEESLFLGLLTQQGDKVEISNDLTSVVIDGVNRGSFNDTKSIFSTEWTASTDSVQKSDTKASGVSYNAVVCSALDNDLLSVTATVTAMNAVPGQTNVDIVFENGNVLTLADDADLTAFLAVWYPFRVANSTGYSVTEKVL